MNTSRKMLGCVLVALAMVLLMSFSCAASENSGDPIDLHIHHMKIDGALLIQGSAYAPFRTVVSAIDPDATFSWDNDARASVAHGIGVTIYASPDEHYIEANGRILYSDLAKNLIIDDTLYVQVRLVAKAYSLETEWNGAEQALYVRGTSIPLTPADKFYNSDILYWLSRIISAESRGEPFRGQIAVGNVVLNRTEDGSFPDTVYGVIFDRKYGTQFSPVANGTIYNDPTDSAVRAAKVVLEGVEVVGDALFFQAYYVNSNSWMARNREFIETIGNHMFYY